MLTNMQIFLVRYCFVFIYSFTLSQRLKIKHFKIKKMIVNSQILYKVHISSYCELQRVVIVASDIDLTRKENQQAWFLKNYAGITLNDEDEEFISNVEKCSIHICADNPESYDSLYRSLNNMRSL